MLKSIDEAGVTADGVMDFQIECDARRMLWKYVSHLNRMDHLFNMQAQEFSNFSDAARNPQITYEEGRIKHDAGFYVILRNETEVRLDKALRAYADLFLDGNCGRAYEMLGDDDAYDPEEVYDGAQ